MIVEIHIKNFLKQTDDITNIGDELITANAIIRSILNSLTDFRQFQIDFGKKTKDLEKTLDKKRERLKETNTLIDSFGDVGQIKHWNSKLNEWKKIRKDLEREIIECEFNIENTNKEIFKLEKQWGEEVNKETKEKELKEIKEVYDKVISSSEKIGTEVMDDIKIEVEKRTKEQFMNLTWKETICDNVILDADYKLKALDKFENNAKNSLSAGERQLLALSLTIALNKVSGFNAPIIIDTPLGRLDGDHRLNFAEYLPKFLKDKQVILLITDTEYTEEVRDILLENVGKEYKVLFKDAEERYESVVMPYDG